MFWKQKTALTEAENTSLLAAAAVYETVKQTQAMISFTLDGTILWANDLFLNAMGYRADEVVGKHHRMFCKSAYTASPAYQKFWQDLSAGKTQQGDFERVHKSGKSVWIGATYAAVRDADGKISQITKLAQDITDRKIFLDEFQEALSGGPGHIRNTVPRDSPYHKMADQTNKLLSGMFQQIEQLQRLSAELGHEMDTRLSSDQGMWDRASAQQSRMSELASASRDVTNNLTAATQRLDDVTSSLERSGETSRKGSSSMEAALSNVSSLDAEMATMSEVNAAIENVSMQTNLLALNASVEAARAGEAGAGFTVVASEIRALAKRSQEASSRIATLISSATTKSQSTVAAVQDGAEAFGEVFESVTGLQDDVLPLIGDLKSQVSKVHSMDTEIEAALQSAAQDMQEAQQNVSLTTQQRDRLLGRLDTIDLARAS